MCLFSIGKVRQEMPEFKSNITIYLLHLFTSCSLFLIQRKVDTSISKIACSLFFSRGNSSHVFTICEFHLYDVIWSCYNYWILDDFEDSFLEKSIFLSSEIIGRNAGPQNSSHPTPHRNTMTYWALHYKSLTHKNKNNSKNMIFWCLKLS